jgi:Fuc2NAc and GlcNAc transferase
MDDRLNFSTGLLLYGTASLVSVALTYVVWRYAIARSILDHPNERSSHQQPTPRGGGLAIAFTFQLGVLALAIAGMVAPNIAVALIGGGGIITLIGWQDDRSALPASIRFAAHLGAAIWALAWLGGLDGLQIGSQQIALGFVANVLAVIGIVWWINLYNFMDGIDGIAAGQAVTVACAAAVLMALSGATSMLALPILLAGAASGFLIWNWAPARIFMGDAGSGFLGFTFATLALASEQAGALPIAYWVLLSGVFVFDATLTLVRRVAGGERWYAAHRSHAYQRLVASGLSHRRVTSGVLAFNALLFLLMIWSLRREASFPLSAVAALVLLTASYLVVERIHPMRVSPSGQGKR